MKSRAGDPQPYQTRDGRWRIAVQRGHGSREHRNRTFLSGSSPAEVRARRDELLRAEAEGHRPPDKRLTTGTYLRRWLASLDRRERTIESYTMTIEKHVLPRIGGIVLSQLGPLDLDAMLGDMARKGVRPATRAYSMRVLSIALNAAVTRKRLIPYNPALGADRVKVVRRQAVALDTAQSRAFLQAVAADRLGPLFTLAISTGLRRGELLALTWEDWDREAGTLRVDKTLLYRTGEGFEAVAPKTATSVRLHALSVVATAALAEQSRRQKAEKIRNRRRWANDLIFTAAHRPGGALSGATVVHALHRLYPGIRFHDLRHTYLTHIAPVIGIERAAPVAGHASSRTTQGYVHVSPVSWEAAAASDAVLGEPVAAAVAAK